MRFSATISLDMSSVARASRGVVARAERCALPAHRGMAKAFHGCVDANFGASGEFRPTPWRQLSKAYSKKVNRRFATLFVSGRLKNAVRDYADARRGRVSVSKADCIYALAHQMGYGRLPARPYFPLREDGRPMESVRRLCEAAGFAAIRRALQ